MILSLFFHTEHSYGLRETVNIFLLPDLSLYAGSEAALLSRRWYTALENITLTIYANTASLIHCQKVALIIGCEATINMLDQWVMFLKLIIIPDSSHPVVYELTILIGAPKEVNSRLRAQARYQSSMLASLVRLVQTEFNASCQKKLQTPSQ